MRRDEMTSSAQFHATDREYIDAHRFIYGDLGETIATAAILYRDRLLRPGIVLPVIRLAPVAPYGKCLALSGNGGSLAHIDALSDGIWLYVHEKFYGGGERQRDQIDQTLLHELLHNELTQAGLDPKHAGEPWANRCQDISRRLGLQVQIQRPRSVRVNGRVTTATPSGCLSYADLARWPGGLLDTGPPLRARLNAM